RPIHDTDCVDQGPRAGESCKHPARALSDRFPEGTLCSGAAMGKGVLILDGIENLRTFVAVADTESLAGAARHLRVAASVVTKRIDQLERRLGTRLFTRTTRRVVLTEVGARYLPTARRLMNDYDEVFAEMSRSRQPIEGDIRIKVPTSMTVAYLAETLA